MGKNVKTLSKSGEKKELFRQILPWPRFRLRSVTGQERLSLKVFPGIRNMKTRWKLQCSAYQMGATIGCVSYLQILASELTDKMLAEFLDMDKNLIVNMHIESVDHMKAIKLVKSKVKFDKTLKLYSLMTTKPEEVEARKKKEMEE